MEKGPKKNCGINIRVTEEQRREIQRLAALSGKESVTDFILSTVFDTSFAKPKNDDMHDMLVLLEKHFPMFAISRNNSRSPCILFCNSSCG